MNFLKDIFGSEALTFDQLQEKLSGNEKIKLVNLADGEYVSKHKLTDAEEKLKNASADPEISQKLADAETALAAANEKLKDYDPEWMQKLSDAESKASTEISGFKLQTKVDAALTAAGAKPEVRTNLDLEKIALGDDGELVGLDEQLTAIKADKSYLFEVEAPPTKNLGGGTDGNFEGGERLSISAAVKEHFSS